MKRETAFNGFFKSLKVWNNQEAYDALTRNEQKGLKLRIYKYAKSLVVEHGYQDIHTKQFWAVH